MRILRDVVVDRVGRDELLAISQAAAIAGEEMSLALVGAGTSLELRVRVQESRPVIVDGAVRHRVRLSVLELPEPAVLPERTIVNLSTDIAAEAV